jgi:hypothetical protein
LRASLAGGTPPGNVIMTPQSVPPCLQVAEVFTGSPGKYVDLPNTISGFKGILQVCASAPALHTYGAFWAALRSKQRRQGLG